MVKTFYQENQDYNPDFKGSRAGLGQGNPLRKDSPESHPPSLCVEQARNVQPEDHRQDSRPVQGPVLNDMPMPIVSIIIPVYNAREYIGRCLDSLLGQT